MSTHRIRTGTTLILFLDRPSPPICSFKKTLSMYFSSAKLWNHSNLALFGTHKCESYLRERLMIQLLADHYNSLINPLI
jgi:hypothetical protein